MKLEPIATNDGILAWQAQARNDGLALTNLFPDHRKMDDWMRRKAAFAVEGDTDCRLLVIHEDGFDRLFFAAASVEAAAKACGAYQQGAKGVCVLDVVGPKPIQDAVHAVFAAAQFSVLKSLTRMQRRKGGESGRETAEHSETAEGRCPQPSAAPAYVRLACDGDAASIHAALHQYFDARAEQLPCMEEVHELCTNGSSFVTVSDAGICSFLLGELVGKKGTIRYWFTTPEGRGKGTGGVLIHTFFDHCLEKGATYQELWVVDDNDNAIKRYEHYGFAFDRLKNSVLLSASVPLC